MISKIKAILFDFGNALLEWDPRYFYQPYFPNDPEGYRAPSSPGIMSVKSHPQTLQTWIRTRLSPPVTWHHHDREWKIKHE